MFLLPASVSRFSSFCFFGSSASSAARVALALPVSSFVSGVAGPAASGAVAVAASRGQSCSVSAVSAGLFIGLRRSPALVVICPSSPPVFFAGQVSAGSSWSWLLALVRGSHQVPSLLVLHGSLRLVPPVFAFLRRSGWVRVGVGLWACGL